MASMLDESTGPRATRKRAGKSLEWVAVKSGTSAPTARLYELAGPEAVTVAAKRAALARVYAELAATLEVAA